MLHTGDPIGYKIFRHPRKPIGPPPPQPPGLTRYGSAPSSLIATAVDTIIGAECEFGANLRSPSLLGGEHDHGHSHSHGHYFSGDSSSITPSQPARSTSPPPLSTGNRGTDKQQMGDGGEEHEVGEQWTRHGETNNRASDIALEYCKRIRAIVKEISKGIAESLGLEANYISKAMNLESSFQIFIANWYPPCPQPELAMGLPPHSDHGLLTLLTQNGIGGLQIQHNGKWVNVNSFPNSFLVNTGDHLEILSNGKYKSVVHQAVVNRDSTRISLAIANGPSHDTVVTPAPELVKSHPPAYGGIKYKEYIQLQQSNNLNGKSILNRIRSL
ncbi:hypothetical protein TIFTF001_028069 [Ficus carica]|uniref:Fe2OG dioxygenase domain-containing protein n=1 Tax=Ficus carica TaxID=3494 RepID=A0AA88J0N5_FICCA|nr:hypothetical protein TIFTF001_028069 [Ficus carica]